MRRAIESYLAWIAVLVQLAIQTGSVSGALSDPLFVLTTLTVGAIIGCWWWYSAWSDFTIVRSSIVDKDGHPIEVRSWARPPRTRYFSCLPAVLSLLVLGWFVLNEGAAALSLADASAPLFSANSRFVTSDGKEHLYSYIVDLNSMSVEEAGYFAATGEGLQFALSKRPRLPWIQVTRFTVIVEDFKPIPDTMKFFTSTKTTVQTPSVYAAKVDDPHKGSIVFDARYFYPGNGSDAWALQDTLLIDGDVPVPFVLRVTAATPGIYTYRVEVTVSHRWQSETIEVCRGRRCAFIRKVSSADMPPRIGPPVEFTPPDSLWPTSQEAKTLNGDR